MALQGTLDTFTLPDVLRLLANTQKSGRLLIQGDDGNGSLYLDAGAVVDGETSFAPTETGSEVLFELLRLDDGSFLFDPSDVASDPGSPEIVEEVISSAESAHTEWLDLSEVIPSLDVAIALADELPEGSATIDSERWSLIVGIGSGTSVRALGEHLGLRELPVLRAARSLVDDGLAQIVDLGVHSAAGDSTGLPTLDDDTDAADLFDPDDGEVSDLPEPLLDGDSSLAGAFPDPLAEGADREDAVSGAIRVTNMPPAEAAILEQQIDRLPVSQRERIENVAEDPSADQVDLLIEELPEGAIDPRSSPPLSGFGARLVAFVQPIC